jgi:hypothetical protein
MRRLWIGLSVVALTSLNPWGGSDLRAWWAVAEVSGQETSGSGNDVVLTAPMGAVAVGETAFIMMTTLQDGDTFSITGSSMTWTTFVNNADSPGFIERHYGWCAPGDGVDSTFTITSSGSQTTRGWLKVFTGVECTATPDDTESADDTETAGNTFDLDEAGTPLACSAGALVLGWMEATTGTTITATTGTGISTQQGNGWAQWRVEASAGNYDTTWTANSNENAFLSGACFAATASATTPKGMLLGILP